ncbi:esterase family protein [Actinotalea sp. Marseille-Q4924]|uniref:alpha/beta hydrolase n=1 Tax=Actinotalea sp. Marseille-Q4924 TaxID=2866571 RepID=UPI001CE44985|nr:alpha/beta hydrolase-fold protein [Actinotalea sp. Marseille-Q4924]
MRSSTDPHRPRRRTARTTTATLGALAVALAGAVLPAQAATPSAAPAATAQDETSVSLDLSGTWRFTLGDDPAFADPAFDDSAWTELQVPEVDGAPQFDGYDGFGWYRLTFDLPAGAEGANLVASMGFLDDVDEAFLNGERIGGSGSMPPNAQSQWFERRLYPVPADAPVFGGTNTLAVRVYDMSGGGGWYQGPVGLFSKDAVRSEVYGVEGPLADAATTAWATDLLDRQAAALAAGDVEAYLATLTPDYVHDGRDVDRRERELRTWLEQSGGSLTLSDTGVEVVEAADGRLLVDTNRTITGTRDGAPYTFDEAGQEFLVLDRASRLEAGNRSRFFRDHVDSALEGQRREYATYLPPSYYEDTNREYPVVYLLHGVNGGSREWEPRNMDERLDELFTTGGLEESVVIMPDGESLWYVDHQDGVPWRSMFLTEMLPQVEAEYRTSEARELRGLTGISMGGFGAYSIGLANPDLFSSLASHMGALNIPPSLVGVREATPTAPPIAVAGAMTPEQLARHTYFLDACEFDGFRFDDVVRGFSGILTAKGVAHEAVVYPEGIHNDDCWLPHVDDSFGLHTAQVRAAVEADTTAPTVTAAVDGRTVTLTGEDDLALAELEFAVNRNDGTFEPYTGPLGVPDRAATIRVRAVDVAGNVSEVQTVKVQPSRARGR